MMLQTTNFNQANVCALYNKGVNARAIALDFLTSKNEKKIVNYLVIPNNFVLSLSLSLKKIFSNHNLIISFLYYIFNAKKPERKLGKN